ncbi:DUF7691 family protein [Rosistilla oblonga]|uniref:DUF7691 domain-containing protein n=1 Tax=Rosistilla oblonga TaxID=2527990 RepID=A0A518ITH0_9BACT|nr:hypothetical protein [Rosistilla oblonga]QDV56373.1 hypothetical protein Mal33_23620 [Rosistilla oblonga]
MAGYFLYSLDWPSLNSFLESPSEDLAAAMAENVSELLDSYDEQLEDDDEAADWPSDTESLLPILIDRLQRKDWYADLSEIGKNIWERAFVDLCNDDELNPFGFECESDGVYWNIVSEAIAHHDQPKNQLTEKEITHFGARPFRYWHTGRLNWDAWQPMHSMHSPAEVVALAEQFEAAEATLRDSRHPEVDEDYEELMSVLDKLKTNGRVLYVSVDT